MVANAPVNPQVLHLSSWTLFIRSGQQLPLEVYQWWQILRQALQLKDPLDGLLEVWLLPCLQVGLLLPFKAPVFGKARKASELTLQPVLPGFGHNITPADRTDVQGIIQYKMFGDKTHTGNGTFALTPLLCHVTKT